MTPLTPDVFREAKAHLYRHGLRTDGAYGEPGQACCTVGHIAAALDELEGGGYLLTGYLLDNQVELILDDLFQEWNPSAACPVTTWNDSLEPTARRARRLRLLRMARTAGRGERGADVTRDTPTPGGEWVTEIAEERFGMAHLNGIPWHQAKTPPRWHKCKPQTKGYYNYFHEVERCACGAIREGGRWLDKNSTRRDAR